MIDTLGVSDSASGESEENFDGKEMKTPILERWRRTTNLSTTNPTKTSTNLLPFPPPPPPENSKLYLLDVGELNASDIKISDGNS